MKTYDINNFYVEVTKRVNKDPDFNIPGYDLFEIIIYYKLIGIKIKIYKITQIRYSTSRDYDNFNESLLNNLIAYYISDVISYKNNTNTDFLEIRKIYSKLYYYISRIKDSLYKIENCFRKTNNKFNIGY